MAILKVHLNDVKIWFFFFIKMAIFSLLWALRFDVFTQIVAQTVLYKMDF